MSKKNNYFYKGEPYKPNYELFEEIKKNIIEYDTMSRKYYGWFDYELTRLLKKKKKTLKNKPKSKTKPTSEPEPESEPEPDTEPEPEPEPETEPEPDTEPEPELAPRVPPNINNLKKYCDDKKKYYKASIQYIKLILKLLKQTNNNLSQDSFTYKLFENLLKLTKLSKLKKDINIIKIKYLPFENISDYKNIIENIDRFINIDKDCDKYQYLEIILKSIYDKLWPYRDNLKSATKKMYNAKEWLKYNKDNESITINKNFPKGYIDLYRRAVYENVGLSSKKSPFLHDEIIDQNNLFKIKNNKLFKNNEKLYKRDITTLYLKNIRADMIDKFNKKNKLNPNKILTKKKYINLLLEDRKKISAIPTDKMVNSNFTGGGKTKKNKGINYSRKKH